MLPYESQNALALLMAECPAGAPAAKAFRDVIDASARACAAWAKATGRAPDSGALDLATDYLGSGEQPLSLDPEYLRAAVSSQESLAAFFLTPAQSVPEIALKAAAVLLYFQPYAAALMQLGIVQPVQAVGALANLETYETIRADIIGTLGAGAGQALQ